jgi:hypothetical protein
MAETHGTINPNQAPLSDPLNRLFTPLARLCLANGMTFAEAENMLKQSFIQEARALNPDLPQHGMVSRLSTATGISRREVTRLVRDKAPRRCLKHSLAAEITALWTAERTYRNEAGEPLPLRRQGEAPSFESLARKATRDIHPRSALEELLRLGIVRHDQETDRIVLLRSEYIPQGNDEKLAILGENVGDHLESAVANLLDSAIQHHEQAVFADELSEESVRTLAPLILQHWHGLRDELVPVLSGLIEEDRQAGRPQNRRVRIGLYSFSEEDPAKETVP